MLMNACERSGVFAQTALDETGSHGGGEKSIAKTPDSGWQNGASPQSGRPAHPLLAIPAGAGEDEKTLIYAANYAVKSAGADIERFQFNTAISRTMELLNALYKYDSDIGDAEKDAALFVAAYITFIRLIAPFAPHFSEEIWETLGLPYSIFAHYNWPAYSEDALKTDTVEMAVQVNGAVRFRIEAAREASDAEIEESVRRDGRLPAVLASAGKDGAPAQIVKIIIVRGRLVSIVAK
jgi:leucyl-tRNA synthetase